MRRGTRRAGQLEGRVVGGLGIVRWCLLVPVPSSGVRRLRALLGGSPVGSHQVLTEALRLAASGGGQP